MDRYFRVLLLITLLVIEFLATTTREIELVSSMWDKSNHFAAFLVLYILLTLSYYHMNLSKKVILLMFFAIQIEVVQHFIEGRFFSLLDIVADFIGVVLGIIIMKFLHNFSFMKKSY